MRTRRCMGLTCRAGSGRPSPGGTVWADCTRVRLGPARTCKPAWRMHDARVAVADGSVHGHEPRHRHRAAIDGEALLLPVDLGQQAPEVRLARGGIEDLRDEHEAVGQRHAPIMYAASEVDK